VFNAVVNLNVVATAVLFSIIGTAASVIKVVVNKNRKENNVKKLFIIILQMLVKWIAECRFYFHIQG
jgi:hypothetical protein